MNVERAFVGFVFVAGRFMAVVFERFVFYNHHYMYGLRSQNTRDGDETKATAKLAPGLWMSANRKRK